MSDTKATPIPVNEHHLTHLLTERAPKNKQKGKLEIEVKNLNAQIKLSLQAAGVKTHQMVTGPFAGTIVSMVEPADKTTVQPEILLALGVSPDIIKKATKSTPVSSYPAVNAPKTGAEAAAADQPALTSADVADQPPVDPETIHTH